MRESIYNRVLAVPSLAATAIGTDTNTDGSSVSLDQSGRDFRTACVVAYAETVTDGVFTVVPQESPSGSGDWVNVTADRLEGSAVLDTTGQVGQVGVVVSPLAPFLRVRITSTETDAGGTVGALILLGSPTRTPIVRA